MFFVIIWRENTVIWWPLSLSGLTPIIIDMRLTHLGSEASIFSNLNFILHVFFTVKEITFFYF